MKNKYYELDKQVSKEIAAELLEQGITSYPAICDCGCDPNCERCGGEGSYERQIEYT